MITNFKIFENEDKDYLRILINHIRKLPPQYLKFDLTQDTEKGKFLKIINDKDGDGLTPLMWAVIKRDFDKIDEIIKSGADLHVKDDSGYDFFDYMEDCEELIPLLIKKYPKLEIFFNVKKYNL